MTPGHPLGRQRLRPTFPRPRHGFPPRLEQLASSSWAPDDVLCLFGGCVLGRDSLRAEMTGYKVLTLGEADGMALLKTSGGRDLFATQICSFLPQSKLSNLKNIFKQGTSLVVWRIRLHAPNAGGPGSIPGQGTKIPQVATKDPECCS